MEEKKRDSGWAFIFGVGFVPSWQNWHFSNSLGAKIDI